VPGFYVPFRLTLQGRLYIEAKTAEEALGRAKENDWDDHDFFSTAEQVDWEGQGGGGLT
jgi:hypothetical protein